MSSNLPAVPQRVPMIDPNTLMPHPIWADWFQKVFIRAGGNVSETNDELEEVTTPRIVDGAVTPIKISDSLAGNGLTKVGAAPMDVNVDNSTLEIASDVLRAKDLGITPAKLSGSIPFAKLLGTDWTASPAANGYVKLGSGIIFQWASTPQVLSGTNTAVFFNTAFPNACAQVFANVTDNGADPITQTGQWGTSNKTATGFNLNNRTSQHLFFNWFAVGY